MKNSFGWILIVLGYLFQFSSSRIAIQMENIEQLLGSFIPGFLLCIGGSSILRHERKKTIVSEDSADQPPNELSRADYRKYTHYGLIGGINLIFFGGTLAVRFREFIWVGTAFALLGWALFIWGICYYMRMKNRSPWLGFLGLLLLPGLLMAACLPGKSGK